MKTIQAYQCPICESVHAIQKDAKACEKDCKAYAKADAIEKERKANINYWRNYPRLNATSLQDVIDMSIEASKQICPSSALKSIRFSVRYTSTASNSHSCPIDGVTNWCNRDKDSPESYPGLTGDVYFEYENYNKKKTDILEKWNGIVGINTGGGGYNSSGGQYSVTLFLDDFPLIKAKIAQEKEDKTKFYEIVNLENVKLVDEIKDDVQIAENKSSIEALQVQIAELNSKVGALYSANEEIKKRYAAPHNEIVDEAFGSLSNEFIFVNRNG